MGKIEKFEDIEAWQKARKLNRDIYSITKSDEFCKDFALKNQIRKAGISVMSNIAEGFERSGTGEFVQFLAIAKGSAGEVRSQLYIALDQDYITQKTFKDLNDLTDEISNLIGGLMKYLRKTDIKGSKFK
jgi:four helix bundle protein